MKNHIHEKGYKNKPLTGTQKESNREKSKTRARVEHVFGLIEGKEIKLKIGKMNWLKKVFKNVCGNAVCVKSTLFPVLCIAIFSGNAENRVRVQDKFTPLTVQTEIINHLF